jgi:hypothetical protein
MIIEVLLKPVMADRVGGHAVPYLQYKFELPAYVAEMCAASSLPLESESPT